jgi:hypothetical protein
MAENNTNNGRRSMLNLAMSERKVDFKNITFIQIDTIKRYCKKIETTTNITVYEEYTECKEKKRRCFHFRLFESGKYNTSEYRYAELEIDGPLYHESKYFDIDKRTFRALEKQLNIHVEKNNMEVYDTINNGTQHGIAYFVK